MKNRLKLYCVLFLITSCKYEDGPLISLTSPMNRVQGEYAIDCVQENGVNIMNRIDTIHITSFYFGDVSDIDPNINDFSVRLADSVTYYSFWHFVGNDKKQLHASTFGCPGWAPYTPFPFQPLPGFYCSCIEPSVVWTITKLSQKKMWLEADFNGNHYEVHLKQ